MSHIRQPDVEDDIGMASDDGQATARCALLNSYMMRSLNHGCATRERREHGKGCAQDGKQNGPKQTRRFGG